MFDKFLNFLTNQPSHLYKRKLHHKPNSVFFEFNYKCNLRCNQCDIWKHNNLEIPDKNQFELAKKNTLLLKPWLGNYTLNLMMGEPFLFKGIIDFISFCTANGISTSLNTNGTAISNNDYQNIIQSGLKSISFSLDGYYSATHDNTRGIPGTTAKVKKTIQKLIIARKKLKSKYPLIYINTIIMDTTISELHQLILWAKKKNLDGVSFQPITAKEAFMGTPDKLDWYKEYPLWPKNISKVQQVLTNINKINRKKYPIIPNKTEVNNFKKYFINPTRYSEEHPCAAAKTLSVKLNGDLYLCGGKQKIGNLNKKSPEQLWNSPLANIARKEIYKCQKSCRILALNRGKLKTIG